MNKTSGAFVVSWDFSNGEDYDILLVGQPEGKNMNVINAFQGKEARDIYEKLSTVKKKEVVTDEQ